VSPASRPGDYNAVLTNNTSRGMRVCKRTRHSTTPVLWAAGWAKTLAHRRGRRMHANCFGELQPQPGGDPTISCINSRLCTASACHVASYVISAQKLPTANRNARS